MIKIGSNENRNLEEIAEEHFSHIASTVKRRFTDLSKVQRSFIEPKIKEIITGKPQDLEELFKDYLNYCSRKCDWKRNLTKVFNYKSFANKRNKYNHYSLSKKLGVNVCPYCNRQFTFTIISGETNIVNPDFDHFLSQKDYPLFGLSFYNLIPSCSLCNSRLKKDRKFSVKTHIHPYEESFYGDASFNYLSSSYQSSLGLNSDIELELEVLKDDERSKKIKNNLKVFKLNEIYKDHKDYVSEILYKYHMSNGRYLDILADTFPKILSKEELYRIAFGNYYEEENMDKRVLGKLTKDIAKRIFLDLEGFKNK